jgi:hypothetical protein
MVAMSGLDGLARAKQCARACNEMRRGTCEMVSRGAI